MLHSQTKWIEGGQKLKPVLKEFGEENKWWNNSEKRWKNRESKADNFNWRDNNLQVKQNVPLQTKGNLN
jgi:hypothetical protein